MGWRAKRLAQREAYRAEREALLEDQVLRAMAGRLGEDEVIVTMPGVLDRDFEKLGTEPADLGHSTHCRTKQPNEIHDMGAAAVRPTG